MLAEADGREHRQGLHGAAEVVDKVVAAAVDRAGLEVRVVDERTQLVRIAAWRADIDR